MLRFGTIGSSSIVERFGQAVREVDGVDWQVAGSRSASRAATFARAQGASRGATLEELVDADDVDAVYIASPNAFHHGQATVALQQGKHVLVEKSACANAAEWADLLKLADEQGLVVLESVRSVFDPSWRVVEAYLDSLGPVRQVQFHLCQRSRRYDNFLAGTVENIFKREMAAGALMDLGVYCLHPLTTLFGAPRQVHATSVKLRNGIDGSTTLMLDYPGFTATVSCSKVSWNRTSSLVAGEDAALIMDAVDDPRRMWVGFGTQLEEIEVAKPLPQQSYVLQAFARMVDNPSLARKHQQATLDALTVMDDARRQVGLCFPNDTAPLPIR